MLLLLLLQVLLLLLSPLVLVLNPHCPIRPARRRAVHGLERPLLPFTPVTA